MYPSQRRNQQPTFLGKSERVGSLGSSSFTEIHKLRKDIEASCIRFGALYAHWRRYVPDWNDGPCYRCDSFHEGDVDPNCPVCFGTGFTGGYSKPTVQWMVIMNQNSTLERTDVGFIRLRKSESTSPYIPQIWTGDIIGRVVRTEAGWETQDRYIVSEQVRPARARETSEVVTQDTNDHLDPGPEIVGYSFYSSYINPQPDTGSIEYDIPFEYPVWLADMNELGR